MKADVPTLTPALARKMIAEDRNLIAYYRRILRERLQSIESELAIYDLNEEISRLNEYLSLCGEKESWI